MNNDKIKIIISLPLVLATILSTTTVVLPLLAYAQEEGRPDMAMSFGDISPEAKNLALSIAAEQLWNLSSRNPSITYSEDGSLSIVDTIFTPQGSKTVMIMVQHDLTPENGYRFDNSILYAPNGTQVFP